MGEIRLRKRNNLVAVLSSTGSTIWLRPWIGRIGGMHGQRGIEIIDLEKDRVAIGFKRAKVMLFVPVVGMAKAVVYFDGADDTGYRFGT
jgi:hypothetical protein